MNAVLNDGFLGVLSSLAGQDALPRVLEAFGQAPSVSVRTNPFKCRPGQLPLPGDASAALPVPWSEYGYILESRPSFTLEPLFHAGAYYVQDSSAMSVGRMAREFISLKNRPLRVLDLCAAPGGKTTDLAALLRKACGDSFILVANEVMKNRASVLADNAGRWGDPCVAVTSADPAAFARLEGFFDIVVADVPCSGEGMFRKDEEALRQWSWDNVALCEARQRRIIADVWPALAGDGVLIYSTCTFNDRENDSNVEWVAQNLGAEVVTPELPYSGWIRTRQGYSLVPGLVPGEGQYCAALRKRGGTEAYLRQARPGRDSRFGEFFQTRMNMVERGGTVIAVPSAVYSEMEALDVLRPLSRGTAVGVVKGRDLVPHADLALSALLVKDCFRRWSLDRNQALAFLHRDTLVLPDAPRGLLLLEYGDFALGFVKNLGNRTNSLLPQGRRIRMDI